MNILLFHIKFIRLHLRKIQVMKPGKFTISFFTLFLFLICVYGKAQVTSASISGTISNGNGGALEGATVTAVHIPSGTTYTIASGKNGFYNFPSVRVGGPFKISVTYSGYSGTEQNEIYTNLGTGTTVDFN
jgi:hypothetical protein